MIKVVGVRFRNAGKIYFFEPGDFELKRGTAVIVETVRGIEFGTCVNDPSMVADDEVVSPLKPILRIASERDIKQAAENREKEKEAFKTCLEKIREHELEMKLIDAEYTFDNSKILFYFTADGRVDFRELVKDLAAVFRTRIELRQVGVRDETKILGGIGICGRPLCCHSYLSDFVPVSIKMAKEQNLSLNPTKISGVCGRLMCCLKNEEEVYEEQNRKLPGVGDYVTTVEGERGVVTNVNIFHETVKVLIQNGDEKELKEYKAEDIRFKKHRKRGKIDLSPEELEQLRALEPGFTEDEVSDEDDETDSNPGRDRNEKREQGSNGGEKRTNREHGDNRGQHRDRKDRGHDNRDGVKDGNRDAGKDGGRDRNRNAGRDGGRNQNRDDSQNFEEPVNSAAANTNGAENDKTESGSSEHSDRKNNRRNHGYNNHHKNRSGNDGTDAGNAQNDNSAGQASASNNRRSQPQNGQNRTENPAAGAEGAETDSNGGHSRNGRNNNYRNRNRNRNHNNGNKQRNPEGSDQNQ